MGRLLNALDGTNTVIAFMSDHGELLGDHGFTEKCLMYEGSVRVPCLLSWQNHLPSGFRVTTPMAGVDLMPTLLSFADQVPETPIDGRSVAKAILNGRQPEPQPIFAEIASLDAIYHNADAPEELAACVMVKDGHWKYIRNRFDIDELYDPKNRSRRNAKCFRSSGTPEPYRADATANQRDGLPDRSRSLCVVLVAIISPPVSCVHFPFDDISDCKYYFYINYA